MRIYKAYFGIASKGGGDDGTCLSWHASRRDAVDAITDHRRRGVLAGGIPHGVDEYNIPATRTGLLAWLNAHFTTDNG